ncbi:MAG TPA: Mur ligase family protein, partial [Dehalococcoidia bacterium]|nr:Mur ligase family protein [Dehalococcoidia bacterium]
LGLLERINPHTRVMIELSHTQLETVTRSPELACVTNVTPNHLDHYSWSAYVALKRRIFQFQRPEDTCVFNLDNEVSASFARETPGRVAYTSLVRSLPGDGVALVDGVVTRFEGSTSFAVAARSDIRLRGQHNVENVLSAVALASRLGVSDQQAAAAIRTFTGVPHRLEPVATIADVVYINDSIATTPERTLAGMRSFEQPLVLLLGGRHKYLPVGELASEATRRCRAVIAFGEAGEMFASAVRDADGGSSVQVEQVADVETAVRAAHRLAQAGDVVLFAPAGSSFDAYPNFERRGAAYREAVRQLAGED